jgi:hypothetical protein
MRRLCGCFLRCAIDSELSLQVKKPTELTRARGRSPETSSIPSMGRPWTVSILCARHSTFSRRTTRSYCKLNEQAVSIISFLRLINDLMIHRTVSPFIFAKTPNSMRSRHGAFLSIHGKARLCPLCKKENNTTAAVPRPTGGIVTVRLRCLPGRLDCLKGSALHCNLHPEIK